MKLALDAKGQAKCNTGVKALPAMLKLRDGGSTVQHCPHRVAGF